MARVGKSRQVEKKKLDFLIDGDSENHSDNNFSISPQLSTTNGSAPKLFDSRLKNPVSIIGSTGGYACIDRSGSNSNSAVRPSQCQTMQPPPTPHNHGRVQRQAIGVACSKMTSSSISSAANYLLNLPMSNIRSATNHHLPNKSVAARDYLSMPPPDHTPLRAAVLWNGNIPPKTPTRLPTENPCDSNTITTFSKPPQIKSDDHLIATPPQQRECHGIMDGHLDSRGTKISDGSQSSSVSSPSETPFRFNSFPASLPRVNPRSSCARAITNINNGNANNDKTPARAIQHGMFQSPLMGNGGISKQLDSAIPGTIRKRMVFTKYGDDNDNDNDNDEERIISDHFNIEPDNIAQHHTENHDDYLNTSIDSQITCMSSLSGDGTTPNMLPSRNKAILDSGTTSGAVWLSPVPDNDNGQFIIKGSTRTIIPKIDMVDQDEVMLTHDAQQRGLGVRDSPKISPSHDVTGKKAVVRTRLNFNSLTSPDPAGIMENFRDSHQDDDNDTDEDTTPIRNGDDSLKKTMNLQHDMQHDITQSYDQIRTSSFPSVSTDTPGRNISEACVSGDDTLNTASGAFLPLMNGSNTQEEHFRLHLDSTQCSPIAKLPKDVELQGDMEGRALDKNNMSPMIDTLRDRDLNLGNGPISRRAGDAADELKKNRIRGQQLIWDSSNRTPSPQKSALGDHSGESSVMSGSSSTARNPRPMPDASAFDIGSSTTISSFQNTESCGEVGDHSGTSAQPHPLKILCPPTPVRTPAWAHNGGLVRKNSLNNTKLLADCHQTLDELSSFENSIIEDEKSSSQHVENYHNSNVGSFLTVREEDESGNTSSETGGSGSALYKNPHHYDMYMDGTRKRRSFGSSLKSVRSDAGLDTEMSINETPSKVSKPVDEVGAATFSFESDFVNLGRLGSGSFADVFKARLKSNGSLYAVKQNRRQFRGINDRERAMAEVRMIKRLQSPISTHESSYNMHCPHVLHFIRAWQEDGHLFCQTELCCRDTCQQLMESLTTNWESSSKKYPSLVRNLPASCHDKCGHLIPEKTIWKIFHDVTAGLAHIHSHGIVHQDIKPVNILFASQQQYGALCKIGDFGIAGDIGTEEDGQEGDYCYMPQELLSTSVKDPSGDIFSLGLTMYELSSSGTWTLPTEGIRWSDVRNGAHVPELPPSRSKSLISLIQSMISSNKDQRPSASATLESNEKICSVGMEPDSFLSEYIRDVQNFDQAREREVILAQLEADKSRHTPTPLVSRRNTSGIK